MFMEKKKQTIAETQVKPKKETPETLLTTKKTLKPGQELLED